MNIYDRRLTKQNQWNFQILSNILESVISGSQQKLIYLSLSQPLMLSTIYKAIVNFFVLLQYPREGFYCYDILIKNAIMVDEIFRNNLSQNLILIIADANERLSLSLRKTQMILNTNDYPKFKRAFQYIQDSRYKSIPSLIGGKHRPFDKYFLSLYWGMLAKKKNYRSALKHCNSFSQQILECDDRQWFFCSRVIGYYYQTRICSKEREQDMQWLVRHVDEFGVLPSA